MSAVSAELLKVRTTKVWWGLLIGLLVWAVLWTLPGAFTAGMTVGPGQTLPDMTDNAMAREMYTTASGAFGYVFTMVLGVLVMAGENHHKTITPTFLATPRRPQVVLAKLVSTAVYSLLYGVLALAFSIAVAVVILQARGLDTNLAADGLPRALAMALLGFVLWGWIGVGLGTLLGNQIVAILVGIGFIVIEFIARVALSFFDWGPPLIKWLPSSATTAMLSPTNLGPDGTVLESLTWSTAVLVLLAYAAVMAGIGAVLTLRRDVT